MASFQAELQRAGFIADPARLAAAEAFLINSGLDDFSDLQLFDPAFLSNSYGLPLEDFQCIKLIQIGLQTLYSQSPYSS
jgi:hypothetical protein